MHVFRVFKGNYVLFNKVSIRTNAKFLEDDYVNNFNPRSKVVLAELDEPVIEQWMKLGMMWLY